MSLISEKINSKLNDLVGRAFHLNRVLDRGMSLLNVRWKLINCAKELHPKLAHAMLGDEFADSISEYQGLRGNETIYPETIRGDKDYNSPVDFFDDILEEFIKYSDIIEDVIDEVVSEGDHATKVFLDGLLNRLVPYIDQVTNLQEIITNYGSDKMALQLFDSNIDKYLTV